MRPGTLEASIVAALIMGQGNTSRYKHTPVDAYIQIQRRTTFCLAYSAKLPTQAAAPAGEGLRNPEVGQPRLYR